MKSTEEQNIHWHGFVYFIDYYTLISSSHLCLLLYIFTQQISEWLHYGLLVVQSDRPYYNSEQGRVYPLRKLCEEESQLILETH